MKLEVNYLFLNLTDKQLYRVQSFKHRTNWLTKDSLLEHVFTGQEPPGSGNRALSLGAYGGEITGGWL